MWEREVATKTWLDVVVVGVEKSCGKKEEEGISLS